MKTNRYDIAIVGSGFAGSLLAMIARRVGRSVVLLERGKHPRFAIGESSTPLSNLLLEELVTKYDLPRLRPFTKWGSWQDAHPGIACGLKRGFTFFHHTLSQLESVSPARSSQLLVAASPHDRVADTHWYREDFDLFLVNEAQQLGADYFDQCELLWIENNHNEVRLTGKQHGREITISATFLVDASGPRGFLHKALRLRERALPEFPATQALYSHFSGVKRLDELLGSEPWCQAPYPVENAAVHHLFDGGWIWVLHFANGITSAGVAATDRFANQMRLSDRQPGWEGLLQQLPMLREQFAGAQTIQPFRYTAQLGFRSAAISGPNWALLPSAAGFVDPLLSTGFPLTLLGIMRLGEIIEAHWQTNAFGENLESYALKTDSELVATSRLIGALYANMGNFPIFSALSLIYFAVASYSETARRLGKQHLAKSFLLNDHPQFGADCAQLLERASRIQTREESEELIAEIYRLIEPFDVAGLGRKDRSNWYPFDAEDLLRSGHKLGANREELLQMLNRCGFHASTLQM